MAAAASDRDGTDVGEGEGIDLRDLAARVERIEREQADIRRWQRAVTETLDRHLRFTARELRALLA